MISIEYIKTDGVRIDFTNILKKITWSGDINSCSRKLEFEIIYSRHENIPKLDIPLSGFIIFYENGKELFRGFVFEREKGENSISFIAFDYMEKLNKIKVSYNIKNLTPVEITEKFLTDYNLKIGPLAPASTKIKKLFIGVSAYDLIMSSYYEESKANGKKYMIRANNDTCSVIEKGTVTLKLSFEEGKNLISSSYKESLETMVNQVIIVDEKGDKKDVVRDSILLHSHGLYQEVYKSEEGKDSIKEAKSLLKGAEQTSTLEGFGDTTCITGYSVSIKDTMTGLLGLFWIDSDTHTWEGSNYKISLDLNFKNIMSEVEAGETEEDAEENKSSSSKSSSSSSSGGNSKLVTEAKKYLGVPYVWGGTTSKGLDCSGLTQLAHKNCGISIPRTSKEQSQSGTSIAKANLKAGDLVFFSTNGTGKVSHVGMYIGNNQMVHAPKPGDVVKIASINTTYYNSKYVNARRYW